MSWILREGHRSLTLKALFTLLLIELYPDEIKPPFWNVCKSSADPQNSLFLFEHQPSQINLYCQTRLTITTSRIEYP